MPKSLHLGQFKSYSAEVNAVMSKSVTDAFGQSEPSLSSLSESENEVEDEFDEKKERILKINVESEPEGLSFASQMKQKRSTTPQPHQKRDFALPVGAKAFTPQTKQPSLVGRAKKVISVDSFHSKKRMFVDYQL